MNSKIRTVLYDDYFDEYAKGYFKLNNVKDISLATNYGVLAPVYKSIFGKKYQNTYRTKRTLGIVMHFDSRLELSMNGIRGFINKILLKLLRFLDTQRKKVTDQ